MFAGAAEDEGTPRRLRPRVGDLRTRARFLGRTRRHHSAVPRERDFRLRNGDLLQQACVYNSTEKTSTTRFGMSTETEMCIAYIDYSVPRNASNLIRKQRAMWNGPLAPGVAVSSAVGPTPPAAGYRR